MKVKIKSFNGELPSYLTAGKVYDADEYSVCGKLYMWDDTDDFVFIRMKNCPHLNGGSWEIVDDNTTDNAADIKYHVSPSTMVIE